MTELLAIGFATLACVVAYYIGYSSGFHAGWNRERRRHVPPRPLPPRTSRLPERTEA